MHKMFLKHGLDDRVDMPQGWDGTVIFGGKTRTTG